MENLYKNGTQNIREGGQGGGEGIGVGLDRNQLIAFVNTAVNIRVQTSLVV